MLSYIIKRLLLMIPTLFGVLLVTFAVIQFVPGGPVEQMVSQLQGRDSGGEGAAASGAGYRGRQGVDAKRIEEIKQLYGFDKPAHERFIQMVHQFGFAQRNFFAQNLARQTHARHVLNIFGRKFIFARRHNGCGNWVGRNLFQGSR
jgi:microcin C transport system permease protein